MVFLGSGGFKSCQLFLVFTCEAAAFEGKSARLLFEWVGNKGGWAPGFGSVRVRPIFGIQDVSQRIFLSVIKDVADSH